MPSPTAKTPSGEKPWRLEPLNAAAAPLQNGIASLYFLLLVSIGAALVLVHMISAEVEEGMLSVRLETYLAAAIIILGFSALAAALGLWRACRANKTLRAHSRRMRQLIDSSQEGVICLDGQSLIAYVNPTALRLLGGYALEELQGLPLHDTLHHSLRDGSPHLPEDCALCRARTRGESIQCECHFLRKDGTGIDIEVSLAPVLDADSSFAWLIFFKDITESRNMLAITQAVFQSSVDAHGIWQDGRLVECSPSAPSFFKVASSQELEEKVLNQTLYPAIQPDGRPSRPALAKILEQFAASGFERYEWLYMDGEGNPLPCENTLIRIVYNGYQARFCYTRDLRPLRRTEDSLRKEREQLRAILDKSPAGIGIFFKRTQQLALANPSLRALITSKTAAPWPKPSCATVTGRPCAKHCGNTGDTSTIIRCDSTLPTKTRGNTSSPAPPYAMKAKTVSSAGLWMSPICAKPSRRL